MAKKVGKKKVSKKTPAKKGKEDEEIDETMQQQSDDDAGDAVESDAKAAKKAEREAAKAAKKAEREARRAERKAGGKKTGGRRQLGKQTVVFFMGQLIAAGLIGEELPEEQKDMGRIAQRIRQMAEKLARQTLRHGEGDIALGGGEGEEGEDEDTE